MRCAICGKITREVKNDMCLRCYVVSRSIRLEPEMPYLNIPSDSKLAPQHEYQRFNLKPFVADIRADGRNDR